MKTVKSKPHPIRNIVLPPFHEIIYQGINIDFLKLEERNNFRIRDSSNMFNMASRNYQKKLILMDYFNNASISMPLKTKSICNRSLRSNSSLHENRTIVFESPKKNKVRYQRLTEKIDKQLVKINLKLNKARGF